ncbi:hypothetical protein NUU61_000310 [Penicillium alfredii]|uniref:BTB domain-containing protein n=1 Tax=Penicillium alfredii TaxID=1506179 RepID=A0A9W9G9F1_9EURO|nr:uncharacterized protein NUU61_000310 [Penicillium alfredii]KAJ5114551.1 hypothetical protein NUU61_000310 [Penicillium alfredii]
MNNGHTRESKHRIAVLEDEDVETFVAFCEYAYTGDYSVPNPSDGQEAARAGVVESAPSPGNSWRGTFRSDSISSAVPPPAPSPPPEYSGSVNQDTEQGHNEPETVLMIEEEVAAEAEAEEKDEAQGKENIDKTNSPDQPPDAVDPNPEAAGDQLAADMVDEPDEWRNWTATTESKSKKTKGKKKKRGQQSVTKEPPASLTPPSTPPLDKPRDTGLPPAGVPEETVEAASGPEAAAEPNDEPAERSTEAWERPALPDEGALQEKAWIEVQYENTDGPRQAQEGPPKPVIDMSFAQQPGLSPREPGLSLWDEFAALEYLDAPLASNPPVDPSPGPEFPYLAFHAKVYVFATRYLIPALAQLCLRKLHRDLVQLSFTEPDTIESSSESRNLGGLAARQGRMVLDLLHYAYTKTARLEPISPTSATQLRENELRRLVVHYAACKVKELAKYHSEDSETGTPSVRPMDAQVERAEHPAPTSLRALLDMTTELASDLVYRMM